MDRQTGRPRATTGQSLKILRITVVCFIVMLGIAAFNKSRAPEYLMSEYTSEDGRAMHVKFEVMPRDLPQQTVGFFFKYQGMGEFALCQGIVAPEQAEAMNFGAQEEQLKEGYYIEEYIIHSFTTLAEDAYGEEKARYDELAASMGFREYRVVRVAFSQKWSQEALKKGPQWGDGEYTRDFVVGKEKGLRGKWKIFELGMM